MSVGDAVVLITNIAAGAVLTYQPAVGVEVSMTTFTSSEFGGLVPYRSPRITVRLVNAIGFTLYRTVGDNTRWNSKPMLLTNTLYLGIVNESGGSRNIGYSGVQIK